MAKQMYPSDETRLVGAKQATARELFELLLSGDRQDRTYAMSLALKLTTDERNELREAAQRLDRFV